VAEGRLQTLADAAGIGVERKQSDAARVTRDPALLLDLLLTAL